MQGKTIVHMVTGLEFWTVCWQMINVFADHFPIPTKIFTAPKTVALVSTTLYILISSSCSFPVLRCQTFQLHLLCTWLPNPKVMLFPTFEREFGQLINRKEYIYI